MEEKYRASFIQLSDLHINEYRNLLEPMINEINKEKVDFVVVTGDLTDRPEESLYKIAMESLNKITHKVIVLAGDCDYGEFWTEFFGKKTYSSMELNDICFEFLDTSFLRSRYAVGWGDTIEEESKDQYDWLVNRLHVDKYHIIFSHHTVYTEEQEKKSEFLKDNVRAIYSGHSHEEPKYQFKYEKPRADFESGFFAVPLKFHGNSVYMVVSIKDNYEIINMPRDISVKYTAW